MKVNSGTILLAFFAVVSGLIGVHLYREANRPAPIQPAPVDVAEKPKPPKPMIIPMVSRNLTPGQTVSKDDVALVRLTRDQMSKMGLNKAFMTQPSQIIGKTLKRELKRGATFDTRDFYPVGQGPGISHRLQQGLRAITVSMLPTNALIGFAGAGQKVDVLFHYGESAGPDMARDQTELNAGNNYQRGGNISASLRSATSTLIQGVEILAFNQQTAPAGEVRNLPMDQRVLVTLAVFPREAELLRMASGHGELSLTLRSPNDVENVPTVTPRTLDEIIQVREEVRQMEIFRGKQVSRLAFQGGSVIRRSLHDGSRDNEDRFKQKRNTLETPRSVEPDLNVKITPQSEPIEPTLKNGFTDNAESNATAAEPASWRGDQ